jgi:voltage-gated potassium channel
MLNGFIARQTILFFVIIILIVILGGTIAFYSLEDRSFFNSLYFTSVTMSTIGYGDMAPTTYAGKLVAMFYGFM